MTCSMVQPATHHSRPAAASWWESFRAAPTGRALDRSRHHRGRFDGVATKEIMADKWLKVAVNVQSAFHAVIDARDHDTNEFQALKVGILEETRRVFKAAKIRARSCDGRDPSVEDMIESLRKPAHPRTEHGVKVRNSIWQDLYLKRRAIEADYVHGPVIALGEKHGVATP
jgi:ketopantoate reductase